MQDRPANHFTFTLEHDPDDHEFRSIFIDNGYGTSAEICGKMSSRKFGLFLLGELRKLSQEEIHRLFNIKA